MSRNNFGCRRKFNFAAGASHGNFFAQTGKFRHPSGNFRSKTEAKVQFCGRSVTWELFAYLERSSPDISFCIKARTPFIYVRTRVTLPYLARQCAQNCRTEKNRTVFFFPSCHLHHFSHEMVHLKALRFPLPLGGDGVGEGIVTLSLKTLFGE